VDGGSVITDTSGVHATVKREWNDGSAKHIIVSGAVTLPASGIAHVELREGTPGGTPLSESVIVAAAPQASVTLGALGTVNLSSLLGSPFRTWIATPTVIECHYLSKALHADVWVWFHVRRYSAGHTFVRVIVEYSKIPYTSNTNLQYAPSVSIGGQVVWNNSGATYTHALETRWVVEGWAQGGTAYAVRHDLDLLRRSRLVPNFWSTNPSDATLSGLDQPYTPGSLVGLRANYEGTGYSPQIGLLPLWDVHYLTTGDARAWRAVQANSLAAGTQATIWRDPNTNRAIRPSDWATWSYSGNNGGGHTTIAARNSANSANYTWDRAHNASSGYTAYLLTGEYVHLETMHMQAASIYLGSAASEGSGTNRIVGDQTRSVGWFFRTVGQLAGIAPDGDVVAADMAAWMSGNVTYHKSIADTYPNGIGYSRTIGTYNASQPLSVAPWMHSFWIQSMGHASDLEPLADMTNFNALRDWMYRGVVGMLGDGSPGTFDYRYAGMYNITVSADVRPNFSITLPNQMHANWGDVFTASYAAISSYIVGGNMPAQNVAPANTLVEPFWGGFYDWAYFKNLMPAIAYAAEHDATGADAAWARLRGALNWRTLALDTMAQPMWACEPRGAIAAIALDTAQNDWPAWRAAMAANTWSTIPATNTLDAIDPEDDPVLNTRHSSPAIWRGNGGQSQVVAAWNGAVLDPATDTLYMDLNGGHGDTAENSLYAIRLDQNAPAWSLEIEPSGARYTPPVPSDLLSAAGNLYYDGMPRSQHTRSKQCWVPGHGIVLVRDSGGYPDATRGTENTWLTDPVAKTRQQWATGVTMANICAGVYDPSRNCIWRIRGGGSGVHRLNIDTEPRQFVSVTTTGWNDANTAQDPRATYIPDHDVIAVLRSNEAPSAHNDNLVVFDPATSTHHPITLTGSKPAGLDRVGHAGASWVPSLGALCIWHNSSNTTTIATLTPTGNPRTAPWAWGTLSVALGNSVTPTARKANGTYGRFVYSPRLNGFYLLNDTAEPVYFFALS
jgi:hypothetical protein